METIRTIILVIGWPILIGGSIFLIYRTLQFHRAIGKIIWGKLVLAMVVGWLVSMYSLGITATAYMFTDVETGVLVVFPIFLLWFITMVLITWSVLSWSKEALTLSAFYKGLEEAVDKKAKELQESYELRVKNEEEIRKLRERFVFIAAHELRAPVTAIKWILDSFLNDKDFQHSLTEEQRKLLSTLHNKNQALIYLVEDLLHVARLQNKTETLPAGEVSLLAIILEIKESVLPLAEEMKVTLYWPGGDTAIPPVKADGMALKEILTNLVVNAIRYNRESGWVVIDSQAAPSELIIHVKDSGIGMTGEEMQNLFQEFYRVKNQETQVIDGTGLGLFICKQLLERMGGRIWVESTKGVGSTFSFTLPLYISR